MSNQLLASKTVIMEEEPKVRGIKAASTSVAGAVGIAERGPLDQAIPCTSLEDYQQVFGGFTPDSDLALAVKGFYENGGGLLWVVRTCHHTDISDPASAMAVRALGDLSVTGVPAPAEIISGNAEPFSFEDGDQFALSVNGDPEVSGTLDAEAARHISQAMEPFALVDGQTLEVVIDDNPAQVISFPASAFADIGAATADEVAAEVNKQLTGARSWNGTGHLYIESDVMGAGSRVEISGGSAASTFNFLTGPVIGTGYAQNIKAVTVAELLDLIETYASGYTLPVEAFAAAGGRIGVRTVATGPSASLQVGVATTDAFGFDNDLHEGSDSGTVNVLRVEGKDPGAYANRIEAEISPPTSGETGFFNLGVVEDGVDRRGFPNVCMDPNHDRYVEKMVNDARSGSALIRVVDLLVSGAQAPDEQIVQLAGGDDGLTGLDDNDFIGSKTGKTGLHALNKVQDLSLLFVPGRATPANHDAMIAYCEVERDGFVFPVLDPPEEYSAVEIVDYVKSTAALQNLSENGAIYWPRVEILNPSKAVFGPGEKIVTAPSGIVCGVFARTDAARPGGVYDPPAGTEKGKLFGVLGFETDEVLEESYRDIVYPERINPLTTAPGAPRFIDGSRTLKGDGQFPYVAEKRGVIFIRRSLKEGLRFARHKNNDESLRAQVLRTIKAFLTIQMNNGAFQSKDPRRPSSWTSRRR